MDCLVADSRRDLAEVATRRRNAGIAAGVAGLVLVADQLTKAWARGSLADRRVFEVAGPVRFRLVHNSGSAFGIGGGLGPLIAVMALMAVGGIIWYSRSVGSTCSLAALGTIAGGALGNFVDRVDGPRSGFLSGSVTDFIDVGRWPVFNVADLAITLGGAALVILSSLSSR